MRFEDCRFGLVVRHGMYGLGMIEVLVPKTSTVNVCFEAECVNMSPFDLELLGDIRIFHWVPKLAKVAEKLAISDSDIHNQTRAMTEEDEQDKRVQEEIQVHTVRYQQAKDTFQAARNLVERWAKRVPEFGSMVPVIDEKLRIIEIQQVGREDGENDEIGSDTFQVWFEEDGDIWFLENQSMDEVRSSNDLTTAEKWLAAVESAVAKRIAWLRVVRGENRAKAYKQKSKV